MTIVPLNYLAYKSEESFEYFICKQVQECEMQKLFQQENSIMLPNV